MVLTKKQKIAAYRYALKELKAKKAEVGKNIISYCTCQYLEQWMIDNTDESSISLKMLAKLFPEFRAKKPRNALLFSFWWNSSDFEPREKALKECIKELS